MGLPKPEPHRLMRKDELSLLHLMMAADKQGIDKSSLVRVLRAFSQNGKRMAEAMRDLFRSDVEGPLLASGMSVADMMTATAPRRVALQNIGFTTIRLLLSRYTEDVVFDNIATRIEATLAERGDAKPRDNTHMAITFVDLEGFTTLTREAGDEAAGDVIARFEDAAHEVLAAHGGRLVKSLGDGLLSTFSDPADAVPASLAMLRRLEKEHLPRGRVGLSIGSVLRRDGDVFGNTVNLAARLVSIAGPGEIAADARSAVLLSDLPWAPEETLRLKGLGDVVVRKLGRPASGGPIPQGS
jgi:adenylate cyclase